MSLQVHLSKLEYNLKLKFVSLAKFKECSFSN